MNHSFKNTLVTIFSVFAMLVSSLVSSTPMMVKNSMLSFDAELVSSHHNHTPSDHFHITVSALSACQQVECHSDKTLSQLDDQLERDSSHCDGLSVDSCCTSVCSSVSYPIQSANSPSTLAPTLALHKPIKIGNKVSRIQSLLRPPSA